MKPLAHAHLPSDPQLPPNPHGWAQLVLCASTTVSAPPTGHCDRSGEVSNATTRASPAATTAYDAPGRTRLPLGAEARPTLVLDAVMRVCSPMNRPDLKYSALTVGSSVDWTAAADEPVLTKPTCAATWPPAALKSGAIDVEMLPLPVDTSRPEDV